MKLFRGVVTLKHSDTITRPSFKHLMDNLLEIEPEIEPELANCEILLQRN